MCMRRINILSNHEDNVRKSQQDDAQRKIQYGMMLIDPQAQLLKKLVES